MADNDENFEEIERVVEERQLVRSNLKHVIDLIQDDQPELNKIGSKKFAEDLKKLDEIGKKAEYTRELQLDAMGLKHLSAAAKNQALRLNDLSRRYGFDALAEELKSYQYPGKEMLDWAALGLATMALASFLPLHGTMLGAVDKSVKERKTGTRKRAVDDDDHLIDANASKPTEVTTQDQQPATDDSAALKRSALQLEHLKSIVSHDQQKTVDLIDLLVDHADPVQTVENFFDFSFLLKVQFVMFRLEYFVFFSNI